MTIESSKYQQAREALKADPIIQSMAAEIQRGMNLNAALAAFTYGEGEPTWDFMRRALDNYHRQGGQIDTHIGGPAQAILEILKGK